MTGSPNDRRRWPLRALVVALAVALGIGAGVLGAELTSEEAAEASAAPAPAGAAAPELDLQAMGSSAAELVDALAAPLPVPEPAPADARAPTPKVQLGQLEIPSIGLSQPMFEGVTLTAIDNGPSHWPGSAMPGQLGNVVIAGHRTTRTRPFWDLDLVKPGDEMILTMANGDRFVYALDQVDIVDASAIQIVDQTYDYRATIFGCHPKGSARQRIVGHFTLKSATAA